MTKKEVRDALRLKKDVVLTRKGDPSSPYTGYLARDPSDDKIKFLGANGSKGAFFEVINYEEFSFPRK